MALKITIIIIIVITIIIINYHNAHSQWHMTRDLKSSYFGNVYLLRILSAFDVTVKTLPMMTTTKIKNRNSSLEYALSNLGKT